MGPVLESDGLLLCKIDTCRRLLVSTLSCVLIPWATERPDAESLSRVILFPRENLLRFCLCCVIIVMRRINDSDDHSTIMTVHVDDDNGRTLGWVRVVFIEGVAMDSPFFGLRTCRGAQLCFNLKGQIWFVPITYTKRGSRRSIEHIDELTIELIVVMFILVFVVVVCGAPAE